MNLNSLIVFAKAAEANSFSEAGRRLKMPVSTVSRHISDLENHLGVRLLERSTRYLRVTEIGSQILRHAQHSAELSEQIKMVVLEHAANVAGFLRISAPSTIADRVISPLVRQFQAQNPDVRIELSNEGGSVNLINETVDLIFRLGTLKSSSLVARRITTLQERLVASPNYLARFGSPTVPLELGAHRLFSSLRDPCDNIWRFSHENGRDHQSIAVGPHLATDSLSEVARFVCTGSRLG